MNIIEKDVGIEIEIEIELKKMININIEKCGQRQKQIQAKR